MSWDVPLTQVHADMLPPVAMYEPADETKCTCVERTWKDFQGTQGHGEGHRAAHAGEPHHDLHVTVTVGNSAAWQVATMAQVSAYDGVCTALGCRAAVGGCMQAVFTDKVMISVWRTC